ncbi:FecCD family ABC transporter permease [Salinicola avicenniae]|uniref:FecCD family ABC transporter permease n=1 Tax=Salinicola avicenniae TaxID=2916836 RepID=UPI00207490E3|nr:MULTISPECIES: iron ABC transporter permease [unclassified Salinicola]
MTPYRFWPVLVWLFGLLVAFGISLMAGPQWSGPLTVWHALWSSSPGDINELLIRTTRLPRALTAMAVGASLGVAGGIMQTLTRNSLASPGLLGINAGGLFVVVSLTTLAGSLPGWVGSFGAIGGAAVAAAVVWGIAMRRRDEAGPLRLILAGAALTALFNAFSQALLVIDQQGLDSVLFWLAGSVSARPLAQTWPLMLLIVAAVLGCGPCLRQWNVLAAGEAVAVGAGVAIRRLQGVSILLVVSLAGAAVAMAGNIAFVGLIVPHLARRLAGADHRRWLPMAGLIGATLLILADVAARTLIAPREVPIGVMTALIGVPFFIGLIRREGSRGG